MVDAAERARWGLMGRCRAMEDLRQEIARCAPLDVNVHVHGETGTGKELVARALHDASGRRGPFVPFNVAGYTDDLLVAELFGHARGAFTGAVGREGFVAEAENGTLFLDEVGELSLGAQAKLLRFLENGEYHRLGETRMRRAHVRVISATNVDLPCHVSRGLFREDLLYRLVVHTIPLPPLRERGRDILLLLEHFLRRELGPERRPPRLSDEAERALLRFPWPGNVRQLVNEARRLVVSAQEGTVRPSDLSADVRDFEGEAGGRLQPAKDEFERQFIRRALERNGGNRTATAVELGISRQALVTKIGRLGIARGSSDTRSATVATPLRSVRSRGPVPLGY